MLIIILRPTLRAGTPIVISRTKSPCPVHQLLSPYQAIMLLPAQLLLFLSALRMLGIDQPPILMTTKMSTQSLPWKTTIILILP